MINYSVLICSLCLCSVLMLTNASATEPPVQFGNAQFEHKEEKDKKKSAQVTLTWQAIPTAGWYVVKISKGPKSGDVFFKEETTESIFQTPELEAGVYTYWVEGYHEEELVGSTQPQQFAIGSAMTITASKLSAPKIIGPVDPQTYPYHSKVRLAWTKVPGARGYRFRLWEEAKAMRAAKKGREPVPRWSTEIKNTHIEILDAPYSSYMYLDDGKYRWDVAAVNNEGGLVGEVATSYFNISDQWYLPENESITTLEYGIAPNYYYSYHSSSTNQDATTRYWRHRFKFQHDSWFAREWGWGVLGLFNVHKVTAFDGAAEPSLLAIYGGLGLLLNYRHYLSHFSGGWTFYLSAGPAANQFIQLETLGSSGQAITYQKPTMFGPDITFGFGKHSQGPWEWRFFSHWFIPWYSRLNSNTSIHKTFTRLNTDVSARGYYHFAPKLDVYAGLSYEVKNTDYIQMGLASSNTTHMHGWEISFGCEIRSQPDTQLPSKPHYKKIETIYKEDY